MITKEKKNICLLQQYLKKHTLSSVVKSVEYTLSDNYPNLSIEDFDDYEEYLRYTTCFEGHVYSIPEILKKMSREYNNYRNQPRRRRMSKNDIRIKCRCDKLLLQQIT